MTAKVRGSTGEAVYATVGYADVFDLPISLNDVHRYLLGTQRSLLETSMAVDNLVSKQRLGRRGDLVYLAGRETVLDIYDERMARAAPSWQLAEHWGQRIGRLPLVRMVAVGGGLAVDGLAEHDDINFFIVVRPRRLWLARWMITRVCRTAARNSVRLRPDVLVTTRSLEMDDRSMHVAREIAQMAVIVGDDLCQAWRRSNAWIFDLLPNATARGDRSHLSTVTPTRRQKWAEWVLLLPPFGLVEHHLRRRTIAKLAPAGSHRSQVISLPKSSFSPEVCKGILVAEAASIDVEWAHRVGPR